MIMDNDIIQEINKMEEAEQQAEKRWINSWKYSVDNVKQLYALWQNCIIDIHIYTDNK